MINVKSFFSRILSKTKERLQKRERKKYDDVPYLPEIKKTGENVANNYIKLFLKTKTKG